MKEKQSLQLANANIIKKMTIEQSKQLPGFLGRIVPVQLEHNGYYSYRDWNTKEVIYIEKVI